MLHLYIPFVPPTSGGDHTVGFRPLSEDLLHPLRLLSPKFDGRDGVLHVTARPVALHMAYTHHMRPLHALSSPPHAHFDTALALAPSALPSALPPSHFGAS